MALHRETNVLQARKCCYCSRICGILKGSALNPSVGFCVSDRGYWFPSCLVCWSDGCRKYL